MVGGNGIDTLTYTASAIGVSASLVTGVGHGGDAEGDLIQDGRGRLGRPPALHWPTPRRFDLQQPAESTFSDKLETTALLQFSQ